MVKYGVASYHIFSAVRCLHIEVQSLWGQRSGAIDGLDGLSSTCLCTGGREVMRGGVVCGFNSIQLPRFGCMFLSFCKALKIWGVCNG